MDWTQIIDFLLTLKPWVADVLVVLGSLTVIGTAIDSTIVDEKDHGFMKKFLEIPVLGSFLLAVAKKFSLFK